MGCCLERCSVLFCSAPAVIKVLFWGERHVTLLQMSENRNTNCAGSEFLFNPENKNQLHLVTLRFLVELSGLSLIQTSCESAWVFYRWQKVSKNKICIALPSLLFLQVGKTLHFSSGSFSGVHGHLGFVFVYSSLHSESGWCFILVSGFLVPFHWVGLCLNRV